MWIPSLKWRGVCLQQSDRFYVCLTLTFDSNATSVLWNVYKHSLTPSFKGALHMKFQVCFGIANYETDFVFVDWDILEFYLCILCFQNPFSQEQYRWNVIWPCSNIFTCCKVYLQYVFVNQSVVTWQAISAYDQKEIRCANNKCLWT